MTKTKTHDGSLKSEALFLAALNQGFLAEHLILLVAFCR